MTDTQQDLDKQIAAIALYRDALRFQLRKTVAVLEDVRRRREDVARESGACTVTADVHAWVYDRGGNTRRTCSRCGKKQRHVLTWCDE